MSVITAYEKIQFSVLLKKANVSSNYQLYNWFPILQFRIDVRSLFYLFYLYFNVKLLNILILQKYLFPWQTCTLKTVYLN